MQRICNVVLAGGCVHGGSFIGETNDHGTEIVDQPVSSADVFATILDRIGIPPDASYQTTFGSPTEATDGGRIIPGVAS